MNIATRLPTICGDAELGAEALSGPIDAMIVANNLGRPAPRAAGGAVTTKSVKATPPAAAADRVAPNTRSASGPPMA